MKTLTSKFTVFFWLIFLVVTIPLYLFGTFYMKDILQTTEHDKVQIMLNTLKPTLALNISFNQKKEVERILKTILKEKNIMSVEIKSSSINKKFTKDRAIKTELHTYTTSIADPFKSTDIATITISHSYEYLISLYEKITKVIMTILLFSLFVFSIFYFGMKQELNALTYIADALNGYSKTKHMHRIELRSKTAEITTIATTANEMTANISQYLYELQHFNTQLEEQVKEKVKELQLKEAMMIHQSRQAAMGEMLESIAHQWRQPLNIIGLSCANLETTHELGIMSDEDFQEKLKIIASNINYMSKTIDDFRDFLNPDIELRLFDPKQTIEDVYDVLAAQLKNNHIKLTINSTAPIEYYGIENEFKQVLFVLINNSKDAIKTQQSLDENKEGKIEISLSRNGGSNLITVCDNGGGIKEDIIHSVFDPYFTTKFASSGTGIGLYIAKKIIESRMHGSLHVVNKAEGCCFTIQQYQNIGEKI